MRGLLLSFVLLIGLVSSVSAHYVPETITIDMSDTQYSPQTVTIKQGDNVVFVNTGREAKWPASDIHPTHTVYPGSNINNCGEKENMFDSCVPISPGSSWNFTFKQTGRWQCHDHLLPDLRCVIIVEENELFEDHEEIEEDTISLWDRLSFWYKHKASGSNSKYDNVNPFNITKYDVELELWLEHVGPTKAMQILLNHSGGGYDIDCHQPAHQIGRMSYKLYGGEAFKKADASCHSGFYHGAMERMLTELGTTNLAANVQQVCDLFDTPFSIFQCFHGVGHGVLAYLNYDLPLAIETCSELDSDFKRRSCYGGAFMENIITAQGLGAVPGHRTTWVSSTNPLVPCVNMTDDYNVQYECYQMQTSWMLTLNKYNFNQLAKDCQLVPEEMQLVCYKNFGRDVAGHFLRDPSNIKLYCDTLSNQTHIKECIRGAVNVIIDFWGDKLTTQANDVCKLVDEEQKKRCYANIASRIDRIVSHQKQIDLICNDFETPFSCENKQIDVIETKKATSFRDHITAGFEVPIAAVQEYYDLIGPHAMLDIVEENAYCHNEAHTIGRVIQHRVGDIQEAMNICQLRCSTGCYHGILMEFFAESQEKVKPHYHEDDTPHSHIEFDEVEYKIKTICDKEGTYNNTISRSSCIHGLGHAIMYLSNYKTSQALERCALFPTAYDEYTCSTGVFMERVAGPALQESATQAAQACIDASHHPAACYRYIAYKMIRKWGIETTKLFCESLSTQQRRGCFAGLGFSQYRKIHNNATLLMNLCDTSDPVSTRMCIESNVAKQASFETTNTVQLSYKLCDPLPQPHRETCLRSLTMANVGTQGKDITLYFHKDQDTTT